VLTLVITEMSCVKKQRFNMLGDEEVTVCLQRAYDVKWRLWNEDSDLLECCFITKIKLTK
jgi:hypothetical protein